MLDRYRALAVVQLAARHRQVLRACFTDPLPDRYGGLVNLQAICQTGTEPLPFYRPAAGQVRRHVLTDPLPDRYGGPAI